MIRTESPQTCPDLYVLNLPRVSHQAKSIVAIKQHTCETNACLSVLSVNAVQSCGEGSKLEFRESRDPMAADRAAEEEPPFWVP